MSKRNRDEYRQNPSARRGIVVDRDPNKMRVKVQFRDEDETVSHWIDVTGSSSTGTRVFSMPGQGDEVWCAMDAKGEAGCVLGSRYNDKDAPPHDSNEDIAAQWGNGFIHVNTGSGAVTVETDGPVTIKSGGTVAIEAADIQLISGTLTHNGVNISSDHRHTGVVPGGGTSGGPT